MRIAQVATTGIFLAFGLLKFFPGLSPIEELATRTTETLSFGLVSGRGAMVVIATLECLIGLSFVTGRLLRVGVAAGRPDAWRNVAAGALPW